MIKSNLAVLMAERGLKIADVYNDTGISKTTLMALSENKGKGIQFETIDKLCNYLNISPQDFFVYSPFLVEYIENENGLFLKLVSGDKINNFYFNFDVSKDSELDFSTKMIFSNNPSKKYDFYLIVGIEEGRDELEKIYNNLNIIFKRELVNNIFKHSINWFIENKKIKNAVCNVYLEINDIGLYKEIEIKDGKLD
ncbi:helix-turn-helix domain-containing protein [Ligilactobacillus salivarius]|uniref:helix-turn-helix domain-containing protein n=1 Tax=Ligilactobacillus salivarius TaxID=1624 RepID=UPI00080A94C9|nr:helix-turn-helix transcriptional regulator [Ligilactobacillus salivarius]